MTPTDAGNSQLITSCLAKQMLVPAICENNECQTIWFTPSILGRQAAASMVGCTTSPCPKCGGSGVIPDGDYNPVESRIFDPKQWELIASALRDVRDAILAGYSVNEVREKIDQNDAILQYLGKFAPQNLKDLQTILIIIGMVFAAYTYLTSNDETDAPIMLPQIATEIIRSADAHPKPADLGDNEDRNSDEATSGDAPSDNVP